MMWLLIVVASTGVVTFQPLQMKAECMAIQTLIQKTSRASATCLEVQNVYRGGRP